MDDDTFVPHPAEEAAADAAPSADPALPEERDSAVPFVVTMFIVLVLAMVLIAATGDPYGAGCGGG